MYEAGVSKMIYYGERTILFYFVFVKAVLQIARTL